MAGRRCPGKDEVDGRTVTCPRILTRGERYCERHARAYETRRGTRKQRGYDGQHDRLRAAWQRRLDAGEVVYCADGCGRRIDPRSWHLGHTEDRTAYVGPQTVACNTGDGGRRAHLDPSER